jgi:hypothetical protein
VSNYTWCQQHQTPDTFDSAFKANQRRNPYQPWPLIKRIDQALIDCSNYWFGKVWVEENATRIAAVVVFCSTVCFSVGLLTPFKRTESSRWRQHSVEAPNPPMALEWDIDIEPNSRSPSFRVLFLTIPVAAPILSDINDRRLIWMIAPSMLAYCYLVCCYLVYCYLVCSIYPISVCSRHM